MRKFSFENEEVYHVFNRGVDKREIFLDEKDYFRMVHNLFEFNDTSPAINHSFVRFPGADAQLSEVSPLTIERVRQKKPRELMIEILAWCLMPNHYHLLLRQLRENGITNFMRKIGTGYTMYFNEKQKRTGVLFQGCFKAVHVVRDEHFMHLPFYIHTNPLDLVEPGWREGKIENRKKAEDFLRKFRWSSHLDFLGDKNFPSISQRQFLLDIFGGEEKYGGSFQKWLKEMDMEEIEGVILE